MRERVSERVSERASACVHYPARYTPRSPFKKYKEDFKSTQAISKVPRKLQNHGEYFESSTRALLRAVGFRGDGSGAAGHR